jgi:uncharacterized protein YukE
MANDLIAQHPEENAHTASVFHDYANQIQAHGAVNPNDLAQLNTLGDLYSDYKSAKTYELNARADAHTRVANHARNLATNLNKTSQAFINQDETNAKSFQNLTD